jgi:hypothetical protein
MRPAIRPCALWPPVRTANQLSRVPEECSSDRTFLLCFDTCCRRTPGWRLVGHCTLLVRRRFGDFGPPKAPAFVLNSTLLSGACPRRASPAELGKRGPAERSGVMILARVGLLGGLAGYADRSMEKRELLDYRSKPAEASPNDWPCARRGITIAKRCRRKTTEGRLPETNPFSKMRTGATSDHDWPRWLRRGHTACGARGPADAKRRDFATLARGLRASIRVR